VPLNLFAGRLKFCDALFDESLGIRRAADGRPGALGQFGDLAGLAISEVPFDFALRMSLRVVLLLGVFHKALSGPSYDGRHAVAGEQAGFEVGFEAVYLFAAPIDYWAEAGPGLLAAE